MAQGNGTASFDDMIQADRQRRKNEALANEIFGRNRKAGPPNNGSRKLGTGSSLASRVGVAKLSQRSTSNTPKPKADVENAWSHDLHQTGSPRTAPRIARSSRDNPIIRLAQKDLLSDAALAQTTRNGDLTEAASKGIGEEIAIRGTAGPYIVIGTNFAPGTTAADIESAMVPSGGEMQSCKIVTSSPTVIAEMVFAEKSNAENVISTFNNKKADGRILHVYMKTGRLPLNPPAASAPVHSTPIEPRGSRIDLKRSESSYNSQREESDRNRRRADPDYQDGSYGFEPKEDRMDVDIDVARETPRNDRGIEHREERRDDRRDARYSARKDMGRGRSYFDRDSNGGQSRNNQTLYSDDLYPRPRGRGFR